MSVAFSPVSLEIDGTTYAPGQTALSGTYDNTMILWDLSAGKVLHTFQDHTEVVVSVAFSPAPLEIDGTTCAPGQIALSGSGDSTMILWDLDAGEALRSFYGHTDGVLEVAFSPDGQTALSGSGDSTMTLWDLDTGEALRIFQGHTAFVSSVAFSPDGQTALSGSGDSTALLNE
jgi:WD40 repeat protein